MATGYGYAIGACTRVDLSGRKPQTAVIQSAWNSGTGWWLGLIGSDYRDVRNQIGRFERCRCAEKSRVISIYSAGYRGIMTVMETLAELDRLNLEPAAKAQVLALLESLRKEVKDITDQLTAKDAVLA